MTARQNSIILDLINTQTSFIMRVKSRAYHCRDQLPPIDKTINPEITKRSFFVNEPPLVLCGADVGPLTCLRNKACPNDSFSARRGTSP